MYVSVRCKKTGSKGPLRLQRCEMPWAFRCPWYILSISIARTQGRHCGIKLLSAGELRFKPRYVSIYIKYEVNAAIFISEIKTLVQNYREISLFSNLCCFSKNNKIVLLYLIYYTK